MSWKNPRKTWGKTFKQLAIGELSVIGVFILGCLMWKYTEAFHFEQWLQFVSMWIVIMPIMMIVFVVNDRYHLTEEEEKAIRYQQFLKLRKEFDDRSKSA